MKKYGRSLILRNREKVKRNLVGLNRLVDSVQENDSVSAYVEGSPVQEVAMEAGNQAEVVRLSASPQSDSTVITSLVQTKPVCAISAENCMGSFGVKDGTSATSQLMDSGPTFQKFYSLLCAPNVTGSMESDFGKPRQTFSSLFSAPRKENGPIAFDKSRIQDVGSIGVKDGKPILSFSAADMALLGGRMGLALVGKFLHTIPASHLISSALRNIMIEGKLDWNFLNANHILITLSHSCDYVKFICGMNELPIWFIGGCPMRVFKWTPNFHPSRETPIVAVWCRLPGLPAHLFAEDSLFKIGSLIGKPLQIDRITFDKEKLLFAHICVEIDLTCPRHDFLFLDIDGVVCEQPVVYERFPLFCSACMHVGHMVDSCYANGRNPRPPKHVFSTVFQPQIQTVAVVSPMASPNSHPTTVESGIGNEKGAQIKGKEMDKEGFEMVRRKARGQRAFRSATWLMKMGVKRVGVMEFNKSFAAANGDVKGHGGEKKGGSGNVFEVLREDDCETMVEGEGFGAG